MILFQKLYLKAARGKVVRAFLIYFILLFGPGVVSVSAAGVRCEKAARVAKPVAVDYFSDVVMRIVNMMFSDPTKQRKEVKATIQKEQGRAKIQEMKDFFGNDKFGLRDQAAEGFVNITGTVYMKLGKYTSYTGKERSTKVRFRRYLTQMLGDTLRRFLSPIKSSVSKTKMEIKIQHPELDGVVVKLRIDVPLEDIMYLSHTADYVRMRDLLYHRALLLNPKDRAEVDLAFEYLDAMYTSPHRNHEGLTAHTEYERESFAIKIDPSPEALLMGKKAIEIQITADTQVRLTRVKDMASFQSYSDDQIIYELKVPKDQSALTASDIADYPGLAKIKEFQEWMLENRDKSLPDGKGKVSKIRRKLFMDGTQISKRDASERFLVELGWKEGRYFGSGQVIFQNVDETVDLSKDEGFED